LSRRAVVWLIPILLTLHNAEEAVALRRYLPRANAALTTLFVPLESLPSYRVIVLALASLSGLAFVLALLVSARPQSQRLLWLLLALEAAVGLNVVAHVATAAFIFRGYGPGLITALLLNAPFAVYCFTRAKRERWVSPGALRATVPTAFVLHGPVLLAGLWLASTLNP
jgi:Protein of unknown function with HXXEE motif